jgi:hypothetical protein
MAQTRWSKIEEVTGDQPVAPRSELNEVSEPRFDAGALSTGFSFLTTGCEGTRAREFLKGLKISPFGAGQRRLSPARSPDENIWVLGKT